MTDEIGIKVVTFYIGEELFAIDINHIDMVVDYNKAIKIPEAIDYIEGIVNIRGEVMPLINLRKKFVLPDFEDKSKAKIIIVKIDNQKIGLLVDDVKEVTSVEQSEINETPDLEGVKVDYLSGIIKKGDTMILLVDVLKLLSTAEKMKIEEVMKNIK